jgi:uncharacterized membrane protein (DUF4010 family)
MELGQPEALKVLLVLSFSFLLGLEREGRKTTAGHYVFGGVRTFPLIGLLGYATALLSGDDLLPFAAGLVAVGALLAVSYWHKLRTSEEAGVTTEISGLVTFALGALVAHGYFWVATALVVASLLLLELKVGLESLTTRIPSDEIVTFTKFLLLTAVILPVVPNRELTEFHINPFRTWLIVMAVSAVSYGSYVVQRLIGSRGGAVVMALLGGAYSSTVTTVVLARRSRHESRPRLYAGSMVVASGVMYLRVLVLVGIFNGALMASLAVPFIVLGLVAVLVGALWAHMPDEGRPSSETATATRNPLELRFAFLFATVFLVVLVVTDVLIRSVGTVGVWGLGVLTGFGDVDPFIMSLTQTAGGVTPLGAAAVAIVLATASNNLAKGLYAFAFSDRSTGVRGLIGLLLLAVAGLLPLLIVAS